MTAKVLLAGGYAAGRIAEVADDAVSVGVSVPDYSSGPPFRETIQTYEPTGETSTSGFPVWRVVL